MVRPMVSIIIPVYNREILIAETLESVLQQTYSNWECIVVDDHSTDDTCEVVKQYCERDPRIILLKRPKNRMKGANACRNFGFEHSKGTYINWFDSDDLMLPEKLERQVHSLQEHQEMPFTVCQTLVFEGSKENVIGLRKERIHSRDFFNDFITNDIKWLTQAPLVRRSFLERNDLTFDESLSRSQERDFFVKVLSKTIDYHHDTKPYVLFRKHTDSISYGNISLEKLESTFKVNYSILDTYKKQLPMRTKSYLVRGLKNNLNRSIREKYYNQSHIFYKKIIALDLLTFQEQVKLKLGILFVRFFNMGDILFK